LEIFCRMLYVDEIVHKISGGAWLQAVSASHRRMNAMGHGDAMGCLLTHNWEMAAEYANTPPVRRGLSPSMGLT
jgi:hypothetical protein